MLFQPHSPAAPQGSPNLPQILEYLQSGLKATGKTVIVNGGDSYVSRYLDENDTLSAVIDGVNQETVY
ncbi:MAG: hypothetical protein II137_03280, partial [Anaerovibrio sp.]|nr:hypothetical protein [Anaerovibrio sp.]